MSHLSLGLLSLFVVGMLAGGSCLYLVHCRCRTLARWGRRLFIAVLAGLGTGGLLAAAHRPEALPPLGLLTGLLTAAMLWDTPAAELELPHRS